MLKEYATSVHDTTRKILEEGSLKATEFFQDYSMKEMLDELDENTVDRAVPKEYHEYVSAQYEDNDEEDRKHFETSRYSHSSTILRKAATAEQLSQAEKTIGRSLPDDLKEFYALTNGTRPVVEGSLYPLTQLRLKSVQSLY